MTDTPINQEDIAVIEAAIAKEKAAEFEKFSVEKAKEIEDRVRKEMEEKLEADKLKAKLESLEAENKKLASEQEAKMKAANDAFEKRIQELEATKRGASSNNNPFSGTQNMTDPKFLGKNPVTGEVIDVSKLNMDEVEEQSRRAFMEKVGISNPEWGRPPQKYG